MLRGFTRSAQRVPRQLLSSTRQTTQKRDLNSLRVGVVKEVDDGELRVVITPTNVAQLTKAGAAVAVEKGAGITSGFSDALYEEQGATIVSGDDVWKQDVVLKIRTPTPEMITKLENRTLINQLGARFNPDLVDQLSQQGATCFDLVCFCEL